MAVAALNVVIDSSGALAGAQQVNNALQTINAEAVKAVTEIDSFNTKLGGISGTQVLSGFQKVGSAVDDIKTRFTTAATSAGAFMAAIIGGSVITQAISAYTAFDQALVGVGKTADISGVELQEMGQKIVDMSLVIPVAATELASIAQTAAQLGVKGQQDILTFTSVIAKLGTASDLAGAEAAEILAQFANLTGLDVGQDIEKVASTIVELGNNAATTEPKIADMALRIAQGSAQFQLAAPDILGLATAMSELGIRTELGGNQVGVALNAMGTAIATNGPELAAFAATAGLTTQAFIDLFNSNPLDALLAVANGLGEIAKQDPAAVTLALQDMGIATISMNAVLPTLGTAYKDVASNIALARNEWQAVTALESEFQRFVQGAESQLQLFQNALTSALLTLGGAMIPAVQALKQQITTGLETGAFTDFANVVGQVALGIANNITTITQAFGIWIGMKIGGFLIGLTGDFIKLGVAVTDLAKLLIGAGSLSAALTAISSAFGIAAAAGNSAALAFTALGKLFGPIGIAVTTIATGLALLATNTTDVENAAAQADGAIDDFGDAVSKIGTDADVGRKALDELANAALKAAAAQTQAAKDIGIWDKLTLTFDALWQSITNFDLGQALSTAFNAGLSAAQSFLSSITGLFSSWSLPLTAFDLAAQLGIPLQAAYNAFVQWFADVGNLFLNSPLIQTIISWGTTISQAITDPFGVQQQQQFNAFMNAAQLGAQMLAQGQAQVAAETQNVTTALGTLAGATINATIEQQKLAAEQAAAAAAAAALEASQIAMGQALGKVAGESVSARIEAENLGKALGAVAGETVAAQLAFEGLITDIKDNTDALKLEMQFSGLPEAERNAWIQTLEDARDLGIELNDLEDDRIQRIFQANLAYAVQEQQLDDILNKLEDFENAGEDVGSAITDGLVAFMTGTDFMSALAQIGSDIGSIIGNLAVDVFVRDPLQQFFGDLFQQIGAYVLGLPGASTPWDVRTDGPLPVLVTNGLPGAPGTGGGGGGGGGGGTVTAPDVNTIGNPFASWLSGGALAGATLTGTVAIPVVNGVPQITMPDGTVVDIGPIETDQLPNLFGAIPDVNITGYVEVPLVNGVPQITMPDGTVVDFGTGGTGGTGAWDTFRGLLPEPIQNLLPESLPSISDVLSGLVPDWIVPDFSSIPILGDLINGQIPDLGALLPDLSGVLPDLGSIGDIAGDALPWLSGLIALASGDPAAIGGFLANRGIDLLLPGAGTVIDLIGAITGFDLTDIPVVGDLIGDVGEFLVNLPGVSDVIDFFGNLLGGNNRGANLTIGTGFTDGIERDTSAVDTPFGSISIRDQGSLRASDQFMAGVLDFTSNFDQSFAQYLTPEQIENVTREIAGTTLTQIRFPEDEPPILGEDLFGIALERANQVLLGAFPQLGRVQLDPDSENPEMQALMALLPTDTRRNLDSISPILVQLLTGEGGLAQALGLSTTVGTDRDDRTGANINTLVDRVIRATAVLQQFGPLEDFGLDADTIEQGMIDADIMRRGECVRICDPLPLPVQIVNWPQGLSGSGSNLLSTTSLIGGSVLGPTASTWTRDDFNAAINNAQSLLLAGDPSWRTYADLASQINWTLGTDRLAGGSAVGSFSIMHEGGVVGETRTRTRHGLPIALFENAPRFHLGLAADEFPAILQRGEAVIPLQSNARMAVVSDGRNAYAPLPSGQRVPVELVGANVLHGGCGGGGCGCGGACGSKRYMPASLFEEAPRYHDGLAPDSAAPALSMSSPDSPLAAMSAVMPGAARDSAVPMKVIVPTGKHSRATLDVTVSSRAQQREFAAKVRKAQRYI